MKLLVFMAGSWWSDNRYSMPCREQKQACDGAQVHSRESGGVNFFSWCGAILKSVLAPLLVASGCVSRSLRCRFRVGGSGRKVCRFLHFTKSLFKQVSTGLAGVVVCVTGISAEGMCQSDPPGTLRLYVPWNAPGNNLSAITDTFYRHYKVLPQVCKHTRREYYLIPESMPLYRLDISARLALRTHDDIISNPGYYLTGVGNGREIVGSYWGLGAPNGALYSLGYDRDTEEVWQHAKLFVLSAEQVRGLGSSAAELTLDPAPLLDEFEPPSVMVVDRSSNLERLTEFDGRNNPYFLSREALNNDAFLTATHSLPLTESGARRADWLRRIGALSQEGIRDELLRHNKAVNINKFGKPKLVITFDPENILAGFVAQARACGDERVTDLEAQVESLSDSVWKRARYLPTNWAPYGVKVGAEALGGGLQSHIERYRARFNEPSGVEAMLNRLHAAQELFGGAVGGNLYYMMFPRPCDPQPSKTFEQKVADGEAT